MDGTEIPASQVLQDWQDNVENIDKEVFFDNWLFGDVDFQIEEFPDKPLEHVFDTIALDCLFNTVNRYGAMGLHFWEPRFQSLFTLALQLYVRGYVLAHQGVDVVKREHERIEGHFEEMKAHLDELGITFEPIVDDDESEVEAEDIDNPFEG